MTSAGISVMRPSINLSTALNRNTGSGGSIWRRGQKRRRKKGGRKVHRSRIPDRVSIHERPVVIDERTEFGHWEGDTIVGKGQNHGLHTARAGQ